MGGISDVAKHLAKARRTNNCAIQVILAATVAGIVLYLATVPIIAPDGSTLNEVVHPTIGDVRAAYDPLINKEKLQERLSTPCTVSLPTKEEAARNIHGWKLSRYVAYHNIVQFLGKHTDRDVKYYVHDFGVSLFLKPFSDRMHVNRSGYPDIDIHKTPYENDTYDIIAADQVIEHIPAPHVAVLELKRILKPGGYMILTTCAYNPDHSNTLYRDFWRFLPDGLKVLSMPLDGGIKMCGGWGTKDVIGTRAKLGLLSTAEKQEFGKILPDAASRNDLRDPFTTWVIMQK